MIFLRLTLLILFFCFSCNNQGTHDAIVKTGETDSLRNQIVGYWGGLGEDNPVWKITRDSIYYFEHQASYPYELYKDRMVIIFTDHSATLKYLSVNEDTLKWKDEFNLNIYGYRFQNKTWER